ncbi:SRPBCC family protein [Streptomyces sp. NPDC005373]|uniref:SRPBCC family protein n=1 Tax=unclassified Streptomyces TaxID=2593676 RepID=UPI0033B32125
MADPTRTARSATGATPLSGLAGSEAADHLKAEVQEYLTAQAQRLLIGMGRKLGETTLKLDDIAEGRSPGLARLALDGGRKLAEGKGPVRGAVEIGAARLKDNLKHTFEENVLEPLKNLGGGRGGASRRPTVIIEYVDVGVDLRTAYDQWTRYQEFSTFAKGVKNARRADDVTSDWKLKVFWSTRSWKAHTTDQVPDDRIAWTSEGAKGTTQGVVSFHRLDDRLTRVLLLIEYHPKGLFERTGNIWRAQGRRVRLDLKNFARFVTLQGEASDGWRGEIRDGEVVRSHEDAVEDEYEDGYEDGYDDEFTDTRQPEAGDGTDGADYEDDYDEAPDEDGFEAPEEDDFEAADEDDFEAADEEPDEAEGAAEGEEVDDAQDEGADGVAGRARAPRARR